MDNDPEPVQEQKKEKPLNELLTSSIVDIYVGPESTHWPLHERLLCYHSPFLANVFYKEWDKDNQNQGDKSSRKNKSYGFPDEEDQTFTLLVGWLYSRTVPPPKIEKDIGSLLDLYLLAQKLEIDKLSTDVVDATREFYHTTSTYPGLRRVQYVYANTDEDNAMREMMVSSVARQLATTEKIPMHWAKALQRNGQLAVDIIRAIQRWHIEERSIPDVRDISVGSARGRLGKGGFSAIVREGDSLDTEATAVTDSLSRGSNLGVESIKSDDLADNGGDGLGRSVGEAGREIESQANYLTLSSLSFLQTQLKPRPASDTPPYTPPPAYLEHNDKSTEEDRSQSPLQSPPIPKPGSRHHQHQHQHQHHHRARLGRQKSVSSLPSVDEAEEEEQDDNRDHGGVRAGDGEDSDDADSIVTWPETMESGMQLIFRKREVVVLVVLWLVYFWWWVAGWFG